MFQLFPVSVDLNSINVTKKGFLGLIRSRGSFPLTTLGSFDIRPGKAIFYLKLKNTSREEITSSLWWKIKLLFFNI
jgi:hypothetical protein